jgi:hypothetical protein
MKMDRSKYIAYLVDLELEALGPDAPALAGLIEERNIFEGLKLTANIYVKIMI